MERDGIVDSLRLGCVVLVSYHDCLCICGVDMVVLRLGIVDLTRKLVMLR